MGQQQLLLLVLGAIVVGVAIIIGINMFSSGAAQANKDAVVQDLMTIAARAQHWARTPRELGGGRDGNTRTFQNSEGEDVTLADLSWTTPNANGAYTLTVNGPNSITLTGTGVEEGVYVTMEITTDEIVSTTVSFSGAGSGT